jgi:hypothetical protein
MPYFPCRRPGPLLRDERLGAYRQLVGLAAAGRISVELEHVPLDDVVLAWQRRRTGAHRRQILIPSRAGAINGEGARRSTRSVISACEGHQDRV